MTQFRKSTAAATAGLAALTLLAAPGFAAPGGPNAGIAVPTVQLAHMGQGPGFGPGMMAPGQGYGPGYGMGPGQGYGPGPGYGMGPGMMGPGQGYGPGYGMGPCQGYGPGYGMGPGMMGPGMMGPGMMGPGYGYGPGPGYGMGPAAVPDKDLSADDIRARLERSLAWHGNKRVKVGDVKEADDDTIVAEIVTQDGSLVQRFKVDRHSGQMRQAE